MKKAAPHHALLALRATSAEDPKVGFVAKRLLLKLHSATGLIDRLEKQRLVTRHSSEADRPRAQLEFTPAALDVLASPLAAHKDEIMRPSPSLDQLLARFS